MAVIGYSYAGMAWWLRRGVGGEGKLKNKIKSVKEERGGGRGKWIYRSGDGRCGREGGPETWRVWGVWRPRKGDAAGLGEVGCGER